MSRPSGTARFSAQGATRSPGPARASSKPPKRCATSFTDRIRPGTRHEGTRRPRRRLFRGRLFLFAAALCAALLLCVCAGSVPVPPGETFRALFAALSGAGGEGIGSYAIVVTLRLPRVLCVASRAPPFPFAAARCRGCCAIACGRLHSWRLLRRSARRGGRHRLRRFASGASRHRRGGHGHRLRLSLARLHPRARLPPGRLALNEHDPSPRRGLLLFTGSLLSLVITFAGSRLRPLLFWTMGSLSGSGYDDALTLALALLLFGGALLSRARELDAFALGESSAQHVGVDVRRPSSSFSSR